MEYVWLLEWYVLLWCTFWLNSHPVLFFYGPVHPKRCDVYIIWNRNNPDIFLPWIYLPIVEILVLSALKLRKYSASDHYLSSFCSLLVQLFLFSPILLYLSCSKFHQIRSLWIEPWPVCVQTKQHPDWINFLNPLSTIFPISPTESMPSYASYFFFYTNVCQTFLICI